MSSENVRVVHMVRSVGPTSMPWNDLYAVSRLIAPGIMYPPIVIGSKIEVTKYKWEMCRDKRRRFSACNPISGLAYIMKLHRHCLLSGRLLILHIHNPSLSLIGLLAKALCKNIVIVGNLHSDWLFLKLHHKLSLNLLAKISQHFIAVSNASMSSIPTSLVRKMHNEGRLSVILNGIDTRQMGKYLTKLDNKTHGNSQPNNCTESVAIVVARMVPAKNCFFILQLLSILKNIDRLVWFGDGNQRNDIVKEAERLGINMRLELRGNCPRNEVFQELTNGKLYISASKWEGIGVANLEAAALGCWPFLSKIPAHDEVAKLLGISTYPLSDLSAWINAIEHFMSLSFQKQLSMRQELASKVRIIFNLDAAISKYIHIYRDLAIQRKISS